MTLASNISPNDRQSYLDRALRAADWFVRTQLGQWRRREHLGDARLVWDDEYFADPSFEGERDPAKDWSRDRGIAFDTNRGRFLYYYHMPTGRYVPGLNWTMGRALFVLTEAFKITGDTRYRESAEFGAKYIEALAVTDPHYAQSLGAIRELTPQGVICGILDGAQAASGLLMLERVTGQANWLRLGRAFCDFLLRHWDHQRAWPTVARLWPVEKIEYLKEIHMISHAIALPLWHLYKRTGEDKYLAPVLWAADCIVDIYQRPDGALWSVPPEAIDRSNPPLPNHHQGIGQGDDRFLTRNDDGIMSVILAAHQATGQAKYLDAAVRYVRWIVSQPVLHRPFCVFPVQANNVLDVAAAGGEDHTQWVLDNLEPFLKLQVTDGDDPRVLGGFRGEDEQGEGGVFGGTSLEYVVTRVTCYAAGLLFRLSGRGAGAGFSVSGLA